MERAHKEKTYSSPQAFQEPQSMQSTQAPAYHMRMMDLVASHRAVYKSTRARLAEMELHLNTAQSGVRSAELKLHLNASLTRLRKLRSVVLSDLSKKQEKEKAEGGGAKK